MIKHLLSSTLAVFALTIFLLTSCDKKEETDDLLTEVSPTEILITVRDTGGYKVEGARVRLLLKPDSDTSAFNGFDETKTTDGNGQALFDYSSYVKPGQVGFVVLDIRADKQNQFGIGVVPVEEHKRTEKTVTIQ